MFTEKVSEDNMPFVWEKEDTILLLRFIYFMNTPSLPILFTLLTIHSKRMKTIPLAAPDPAKPMKCSLPMLLPNMDKPTYKTNVILHL